MLLILTHYDWFIWVMFPLSTFLFFMETLIKINLKNLYILGISWCFHFSIFSLYWGPPEKPINSLEYKRNFGSTAISLHVATTYILTSDLRLQTFFFIESLTPTHLNVPICTGIVFINSKQIIFTAVWKTQNIKLKACIRTPLPPPTPTAIRIHVREGFPFV